MKYTKVVCPTYANASNILDNGKPSRKFKWLVEIEVDEYWIQDGLNIKNSLQEALLEYYGYAKSDEIIVKFIKEPDPEIIKEAQG